MVMNMRAIVFKIFVLLVSHYHNILIMDNTVHRTRTLRPRVKTSRQQAAVIAGEQIMELPSLECPITLARNPHGSVKIGARTYHWLTPQNPPKPYCNRNLALPEKLLVREDYLNLYYLDGLGFYVQISGMQYEICTNCARGLQGDAEVTADA